LPEMPMQLRKLEFNLTTFKFWYTAQHQGKTTLKFSQANLALP